MQVTGTQNNLERFLAVKKAAEQRLKTAEQPAVQKNSGIKSNFLDLIKTIAGKDDNRKARPAPEPAAETKSPQTPVKPSESQGLLSAYGLNQAFGGSRTERQNETILKKHKNLGNFFDRVA